MRLLRLVSPMPADGQRLQSEFENYFNDNIMIKAGSRIGLLNASIPINYSDIEIDSTNDEFTFRTSKGAIATNHIVGITDGVYSIGQFVDEVNTEIVSVLTVQNEYDIGFMLILGITLQDNVLHFIFNEWRTKEEDFSTDPDKSELQNINNNAGTLVRTNQGTTSNDAFLWQNVPLVLTCSFLRVNLNVIGNLIFGISGSSSDDGSGTLLDNDLWAAIKIGLNVGGNRVYFYLDEFDVYQVTNTAPAIDDLISLEIDERQLKYIIYPNNGAGNGVVLGEFEIDETMYHGDQGEPMYPVIGLRGTTVAVDMPTCFFDARYGLSNGAITFNPIAQNIHSRIVPLMSPGGLGVAPTPGPRPDNTIFVLTFNNDAMRRILGYTREVIEYKGLSNAFTAENAINQLTIPSNIIVELQSLKIHAYDGLLGTRRNIVAIIPNFIISGNHLVYSTPNPVMMSIDTQNDINLRSMRVRVLLREDEEEPLSVDNRIELTFLID